MTKTDTRKRRERKGDEIHCTTLYSVKFACYLVQFSQQCYKIGMFIQILATDLENLKVK